ncbi:hypothetical protein JZ751_022318 [Albula glossodonta]|uniref:Uncharacterized protein n=1 Tax=Albula glossodonta TaxID=121402 RepID=A0A8T2MRI9_9TELE|nr:hypothetical protein JZ751_022318 [Albula glossodonta]
MLSFPSGTEAEALRGTTETGICTEDASPSPSPSPSPAPAGCGQCCLLLVTVCPLTALLTTVLSAACGYSRGKQSDLSARVRPPRREDCPVMSVFLTCNTALGTAGGAPFRALIYHRNTALHKACQGMLDGRN